MERVFLIHGLKRTGNHALVSWIRLHTKFAFFNNVIPMYYILKKEIEFPEVIDFKDWLRPRLYTQRRKLLQKFHFVQFLNESPLCLKSVMVSLEDHELTVRPFTGVPCTFRNILILRDPYNIFASRIRKSAKDHRNLVYPSQNNEYMKRVTELWKAHAREFLGETDHLENRVVIYFNRWFSDLNYRKQISLDLGLDFTDAGFSMVSHKGGGSSFDGTSFNGDNSNMNVLDRRNNLSDKEQALLDEVIDDEIKELAQRIENFIEEKNG
ncbi:MAG: hypothetical protein ACI8R9_000669 [Paraglaciecola sp.]|jgi:hypothetical protein